MFSVYTSNFLKIGETVDEISRFFNCRDVGYKGRKPYQNQVELSSCFDTLQVCDRHRHRQTGEYRASIASSEEK